MSTITKLQPFLADTLWYGMTSRISYNKLKDYGKLRVQQGFNAVQVVVGVPPEVGPLNQNSFGIAGAPWNLHGDFNEAYLDECEKRIKLLNELGLTVLLYGAWGHQIHWIGSSKMNVWWDELLKRFEKYEVIFCLCGESNLWIGEADKLLPDKSTDDFKKINTLKHLLSFFPLNLFPKRWFAKAFEILKKVKPSKQTNENHYDRKRAWSSVAEHVSGKTKQPLLIHTVSNETSLEAIINSEVLSAITTQTGHDIRSKSRHWKDPIHYLQNFPNQKYINLEPWYEGILNNFYAKDQLFAYWTSMLAGAYAFCYGAQGIWNCGDGKFLAHWGKQTFDEALKLKTPELIGRSHKFFMDSGSFDYPYVEIKEKKNNLIWICRKNSSGNFIKFIPDSRSLDSDLDGCRIFDPLKGDFIEDALSSGPLVFLKIKSL